MVQIDVKIPPAATRILANKTCVICLVNSCLKCFLFADVFTANINVAGMGLHREARNQAALNQRMRIMAHDFTVFTCTWLGFIRVHDQIRRTTVALFGHEAPLQTRRETRTAASAQAAGFHLVDDPVTAFADKLVGPVPMSTRLRAAQGALVHSVDIGKDTVLIFEHALTLFVLALTPELQRDNQRPNERANRRKIYQERVAPRKPQLRPQPLSSKPQNHCTSDNE